MSEKDLNLVKGELNISPSFETNKNVTKNKAKGDLVDNSTNQSANTIVNGQVFSQTLQVTLTEQQFSEIVGIANEQIVSSVKYELMKHPEEILAKAFKQVSPMFMATFASNQHSEKQVSIFVNQTIEESLKKQAIQTIGFLSMRDIDLLKLLNTMISLFERELSWNFSQNLSSLTWSGTNSPITIGTMRLMVEKKIASILLQTVSYELKYGKIEYGHFENLLRNGLITNDGNTHMPFDEMVYKLFISEASDKSKNEEYEKEDISTRAKQNRRVWTNWFSKNKYAGTFVEKLIKDLERTIGKMVPYSYWNSSRNLLDLYYSLTMLGNTIVNDTVDTK